MFKFWTLLERRGQTALSRKRYPEYVSRRMRARRRRGVFFFVTVAVGLTLTGLAVIVILSSAQAQFGTMVVHLYDSADYLPSLPCPYPTVTLSQTVTVTLGGPRAVSGNTDQGVIAFDGIPVGIYQVTGAATGYSTSSTSSTITVGVVTHVCLALTRV